MQLLRGAAGKARPRLLAGCAMSAVASPAEVIVRQDNGLGRLTLARSKQLNALGAGMQWQLPTGAAPHQQVQVIILHR
jgi:hypothetical protein